LAVLAVAAAVAYTPVPVRVPVAAVVVAAVKGYTPLRMPWR
jgi:hypothetical protein